MPLLQDAYPSICASGATPNQYRHSIRVLDVPYVLRVIAPTSIATPLPKRGNWQRLAMADLRGYCSPIALTFLPLLSRSIFNRIKVFNISCGVTSFNFIHVIIMCSNLKQAKYLGQPCHLICSLT